MKNIITLLLVLTICGCSSFPINNIAPGYLDTYKAVKNAILGFPEQEFDLEVIKKIPYASMLLKIGKGPNGLLILETKRGNKLTWVSADLIYIVTREGVIVRSSGLSNNLSSTLNRTLPVDEIIAGRLTHQEFYYSYDKPKLRNLLVDATYKVVEHSEETILNEKKYLRVIHEYCKSDSIGWKFENKYWIDKDNKVVKSEQHISPRIPKIVFTITKKPS